MENTSASSAERDRLDEKIRWVEEQIASMSDEEDAAITAAALQDPDNPPWDETMLRRPGRPFKLNPKQAVKLRLDADVLAHFRQSGQGWQTRMNEALRKAAGL